MKKFFRDFKSFAMQGNVMNLAVGVMIGGAFGKIVSSLVNDIFTPLLGLITGGVDFGGLFIALDGKAYPSIKAAADQGVGTLNYGMFITSVIDFILIALCVFIFVELISKVMPKKPEAPKAELHLCPFCLKEIDPRATRCPSCTSLLNEEAVG